MSTLTAAKVAVTLARLLPTQEAAELERYGTIGHATAIVQEEFAPRWRGPRTELAAALLTAAYFNGRFARPIHEGTARGAGGAICLGDIDHGNPLWKRHAYEREQLAGLSLGATVICLRVAAETLVTSQAYCLKRNFKTNWRQAMWTSYHYGAKCWLSPHAHQRTRFMLRITAELSE